jgi:hypothetical protein
MRHGIAKAETFPSLSYNALFFATLLKLSKIYFRFGSCENFVKNSNQLDLRVILFEFVVELSTYSFNLSLVELANNCLSFTNEISMGRFMWRGGSSTE